MAPGCEDFIAKQIDKNSHYQKTERLPKSSIKTS